MTSYYDAITRQKTYETTKHSQHPNQISRIRNRYKILIDSDMLSESTLITLINSNLIRENT